ncbi:MAG TPA: glucose-1-phosphate thymidylyltransferase RfbA [Novosphingobium sp.]|nr:glucose-1-phosphate thymidylyltransferase RfbA [Novosphingobium sp.]
MKGIVLAGGSGRRLQPATAVVNKQLMPVYDKPMIYFPVSVLMLAGIREILIVTTAQHLESFRTLFGDGRKFGLAIDYAVQPRPEGLVQAFRLGADFIAGGPSALMLGDNILYGAGLQAMLARARNRADQGVATVFGYQVDNPRAYGVVELGEQDRVLSIEEKPARPRSNLAVPGLYFYDARAVDFARRVNPSDRGELEITDLNRLYLEADSLHVERIGRGYAWLDAGTHDSLLEAGEFVRTVQNRQGIQLACLEEIAWQNGWIDDAALRAQAHAYAETGYGRYLSGLLPHEAAARELPD